MSERTAPRSGGRTAQRIGSQRTSRERGTPAPAIDEVRSVGGARGERRQPAPGTARRADSIRGGTARGEGANRADGVRRGVVPTQGTAALKLDGAQPAADAAPRLRVAPPAPIRAPRAPFAVVVIALVVAGVLGILLINTKTNENTFRISRLQDQKARMDAHQQQLENQIAGYESTGNLDAAARRLGLVKADTPAYIRLPDGKIIGVPKPGNGQPAVTAQEPGKGADRNRTARGGVPGTVQGGASQNGATTVRNGAPPNGTSGTGTVQGGAVQGGAVQGGAAQGGAVQGAAPQAGGPQGGQAVAPQSGGQVAVPQGGGQPVAPQGGGQVAVPGTGR
ncbi:hypothetical protein KRMM14A1259_64370 [Krasilnikovia sp. MM14-A1259]